VFKPFKLKFKKNKSNSKIFRVFSFREKVIGNQFDTLEEELASTKQNNDRLTEMSNGINQ
jgi:hypothetical protein